jgi:hypothetical protein
MLETGISQPEALAFSFYARAGYVKNDRKFSSEFDLYL